MLWGLRTGAASDGPRCGARSNRRRGGGEGRDGGPGGGGEGKAGMLSGAPRGGPGGPGVPITMFLELPW
ncbi:unnamed protein product [Spirodela intermedia]|uniref:Uncharacterized protein n=1 Tax=Spirodela intermedia TaxID=51605 RepID=A0A7I8J5E8_SPIIN|nr:unnamed protein product [Spirodela intermedia]CAA6665457.1 unnamed protein product [Spirodela intermedia]